MVPLASQKLTMELHGFGLRRGYLLAVRGREYDLHNHYKVVAVDQDQLTATAGIRLRRCEGAWVPDGVPRGLLLRFEGVSRFRRKAGEPGLEADSRAVHFIGFLFSDDETMDGFLDDLTDPTQDLIIGLEDSSAYRIHAARVTVEVEG